MLIHKPELMPLFFLHEVYDITDSYRHYKAIIDEFLSSPGVAQNFTKKEMEKRIKNCLDEIIDSQEAIEKAAKGQSIRLLENLSSELNNMDKDKYNDWLSQEGRILSFN